MHSSSINFFYKRGNFIFSFDEKQVDKNVNNSISDAVKYNSVQLIR